MKMRNKNLFRKGNVKICPRCEDKCLINQPKCHNCGLIFERLNNLSNKEAKKAIIKGEKEKVIYVKDMPSDVNKVIVLLLCGFLGLFGAHNFYLGRYKKATFVLVLMIASIGVLFLNESQYYGTWWYNIIFTIIAFPGSSLLFLWVMDFINIIMEKYKVPGAIAIPDLDQIRKDLGMEEVESELKIMKEETEEKEEQKEVIIFSPETEEKKVISITEKNTKNKYNSYNNVKSKNKKKSKKK